MSTSTKDAETALKHAWKTMRYDHPQICCTLPQTSEVIIHTSHWRIDLIWRLSILDSLLTACIEPRHIEFGDENKNLSHGRDEAARFSSSDDVQSPASAEVRDKAVTDLLMQLVANLPSIGLPAQNTHQLSGGTLRSEVTLDAGTTSAIVSASKKRGLTVTTAVHAALVLATQQVAPVPPSSSSIYGTWGIFNIRPRLQAPYNDSSLYPAVLQIIGLPLTLHCSTYNDLAAQLQQFYKQPIPPSAGSHIREDVIVPFTNKVADLIGQPTPADLPPPSEPMLSSIGIVDRYLNRNYGNVIEIKDFWIGVEMTTPQVEVYLWTWQGKMTLSALYNETFYQSQFIQDFLKRVMDILFAELEVQGA